MYKVVQEYGEYVYHLAYIYVKNKENAEEIVQDVFYNFGKKQEQFRGDAHIKTYLTRMTINRSYDELRKLKRRAILQTILPFTKQEPSAEKVVVKDAIGNSVKDAVFNLTIAYREVIILYYYEDYTIREIANLLHTNENTVRTRLRRAKEQLKIELGEFMEEGLLYD